MASGEELDKSSKLIKNLFIGLAISVGFVTFFILAVLLLVSVVGGAEISLREIYVGEISAIGEEEIPSEYIPFYKGAGEEYSVNWNVLAAIHKIESGFGENMGPSSAGAVGHMQFMPLTWVGWSYPEGKVSNTDLLDVEVIRKYGGYGLDQNKDGKADPYNAEDAIYAAAKYLMANGASNGDYQSALFAYNNAQWYVDKVLDQAEKYVVVNSNIYFGEYSGSEIAEVGKKWINNSIYVWGGGRNDYDVLHGRFDCSSFVHWAFLQYGIELGNRSSVTTWTLNKLGVEVSLENARAGDIVFFDTFGIDSHVAIYLGNNRCIGSQDSTGVSIFSLDSSYWQGVFSGHIRRIE